MTIKVRGIESVMAQLREVDAELGQAALVKAGRAAFKKVAESAKQRAPVDTGALREAITIRAGKPKKGTTVAVVGLAVSTSAGRSKQAAMAAAMFNEGQSKKDRPARRWHFAELGTANQAAHPFLRPALDENAQGVVDDLGKELRKKIAAALKKKAKGTSK